MTSAERARILLVEDDEGDARLTAIALRDAGPPHDLDVLGDGAEVLAYLRHEEPFASAQRPDLILLDLNLPGMHGHEVLAAIKDDPVLRRIPVNVLTTSSREEDVRLSYDHHANAYVTKPVDLDAFLDVVRHVTTFWTQTVHSSKGVGDG